MAGMTLEWQVFLRGIKHRIMETEELLKDTKGDAFLEGQLQAFQEVLDYIKGEIK